MGRNERDEDSIINGSIQTSGAADNTVANATANVTISNVAPAAVGTATISKWMKVVSNGTEYFIPMWT
jgi:hypothetical protein